MSGKTNVLQAALNQTSNRKPPAAAPIPASDPVQPDRAPPAAEQGRAVRQSSREGQANVSAWLHSGFQTSLRLIHAQTGRTKQDLIAEALNDLFAKYNVPQVRAD